MEEAQLNPLSFAPDKSSVNPLEGAPGEHAPIESSAWAGATCQQRCLTRCEVGGSRHPAL